MSSVSNPRFPHTCKVYRLAEIDNFSDGEEIVLYEGKCRKNVNTSLRTFKTDGVIKSDYSLSIPGTVKGIRAGDLVDVTDMQGDFKACLVSDCYAGNLGTTVYFNVTQN